MVVVANRAQRLAARTCPTRRPLERHPGTPSARGNARPGDRFDAGAHRGLLPAASGLARDGARCGPADLPPCRHVLAGRPAAVVALGAEPGSPRGGLRRAEACVAAVGASRVERGALGWRELARVFESARDDAPVRLAGGRGRARPRAAVAQHQHRAGLLDELCRTARVRAPARGLRLRPAVVPSPATSCDCGHARRCAQPASVPHEATSTTTPSSSVSCGARRTLTFVAPESSRRRPMPPSHSGKR